jgi:hypothetical protein
VDEVVKQDNLLSKATELATTLSRKPQSEWKRSLQCKDKVANVQESQAIVRILRFVVNTNNFQISKAKERVNRNLPHQLAALIAVESGILKGGSEGLRAVYLINVLLSDNK